MLAVVHFLFTISEEANKGLDSEAFVLRDCFPIYDGVGDIGRKLDATVECFSR